MKRYKRYRFWTVGVVALSLLSFLTGTSLACFQREAESIKMAEDCCQGHCQHVMVADMAAKCCQSHQAKVVQALPAASPTKAAFLVASPLHVSLIPPVVLQGLKQSLVHFLTEERPPPQSLPVYTLHCALLI